MYPPFRLHPGNLIIFAAGSLLFHLSALYFGGIFLKLAVSWYTLYILDILILVINCAGLRYSQDFSSGHLSKNDELAYILKITGTGFLPVPTITCGFTRIHMKGSEKIPSVTFYLKPGESRVFEKSIHTNLRGIYTMGLAELSLKGFTGLVSVGLPIWSRTFYIYPRLLEHSVPLGRHKSTGGKGRTMAGNTGEYHTFSGLREYREGEDTKRISWSRFMKTGYPCIRDYDARGGSAISICMDRRSPERTPECEDTVLETALALIRTAVYSEQKVIIYGFSGWEGIEISSPDEFLRFYKSTLLLEFDSPASPGLNSFSAEESLYIISGLPDLTLLDGRIWESRKSSHLVAVTEGMDSGVRAKVRILIEKLRKEDLEITEVESGSGLAEDIKWLLSS